MAGQGEFEGTGSEVPDLDDAVSGAGGEPGVSWFYGDAADPAEVTRDDADEFPWGVVCRFDGSRGLVEGECFGELGGRGEGGGLGFGSVVDGGDHARGVAGRWSSGEKFLGRGGAGWAEWALLCEQDRWKVAVMIVFVCHFNGETKSSAMLVKSARKRATSRVTLT